MLWCRDFNRHHLLWDEERNSHLFMASASLATQTLMTLMEDYNMVMLLSKGTPTLQSMATKNWTRVDNVFATANMEDLVVVCDMDQRQRGPGTDHVPVLTTLDISVPKAEEERRNNFRNTDWDKFRSELEAQLCLIPGPCALTNESQYQRAIEELTTALQKTIDAMVPRLRPLPHSRRWWSKELSQLKKDLNWLASRSYKFQAVSDHLSHDLHKKTHTLYGDAIKCAKVKHWKDFLEEIEGKELWMAQNMSPALWETGERQESPH